MHSVFKEFISINQSIVTFYRLCQEEYNFYFILKDKKLNNLQKLYSKLVSPENIFKMKSLQYYNVHKNLKYQIAQKIYLKRSDLSSLKRLLVSNSVDNNLKKGFVILQKSKKIIRQSSQLNKIDRIKIKFIDRKVDVKIEKT